MQEETISGQPGFVLLPAALIPTSASSPRAQSSPLHGRGAAAAGAQRYRGPRQSSGFSERQNPVAVLSLSKCRFLGPTYGLGFHGCGVAPSNLHFHTSLVNSGNDTLSIEVWGQ